MKPVPTSHKTSDWSRITNICTQTIAGQVRHIGDRRVPLTTDRQTGETERTLLDI